MRIILRTRAIAGIVALGTATIGLGACGLAACSTSRGTDQASGRMRIVVAENFWGSIVSRLAGPGSRVTSIITNPATDPHGYEPTAQDARAVASARYVVVNGIGYDAWAQKLLDANPDSGRRVLNVGRLLGLGSDANPHQWYSPPAVHRFIARVTADLGKLDPVHRAAYDARARTYESSGLREYDHLIARIRAQFSGTPIGASESIVTPLAAALGLRVLTPQKFLAAVSEGNEPTESDKSTVDAQVAAHEIEVFVYNSQNATPDVQRIADAARGKNIPVVAVTETLAPAKATFQSWQSGELRALLAALQRAGRS